MTAELVMAETPLASAEPKEDLLETAVRNHARMVYRIAYSVLRNRDEAEDAVQETFLRVLRYRKKLAGVGDPKAWLARIAWRVAAERRKRGPQVSPGTEPVDELCSVEIGADRCLLEQERNQFLRKSIAALPDGLRDPLVLSALEELDPREVGEALGISEAAVRSRAFRARQILRERLMAWMGIKK